MSDEPFSLPPTPLMEPAKARDVARGYKALAEHFTDLGVTGEARRAERQSRWWLTYAITLAQTQEPKS